MEKRLFKKNTLGNKLLCILILTVPFDFSFKGFMLLIALNIDKDNQNSRPEVFCK